MTLGVGATAVGDFERAEQWLGIALAGLRAWGSLSYVRDALLSQADSVYAVASTSWTYRDLGRAVADHLGTAPRRSVMSARFGGDAGQALVNEAAQAIVDGQAAVVLVCGAEAGATLA